MRRFITFSIILTSFLFIEVAAQSQQTYNYQKRFQVKSGKVEYRLTGSITGTKQLIWDDFGEKFREEINSEEVVKTRKSTEIIKNHSLSIFDGKYYYNINLATNEGTKIHKDAVPDFSLLGSGMNDSEMEQLGKNLLGALGGKVEPRSEVVLGRKCDVTKVMGATVHNYKGVTLKSYVKVKTVENTEEAISFQENVSLSSSMFTPPSGVTLEDVSAEVSGDEDFLEDIEEEEGLLFPSGIDFPTFKSQSERIRRELGYVFAIHDASGGQYSSMWTKRAGSHVSIVVTSLRNYSNWQEDFADDGIEYFTHKGLKMAFRSDSFFDEESGESTPGSILMIESKSKDAFIRISSTPQKNRAELIAIFEKFN